MSELKLDQVTHTYTLDGRRIDGLTSTIAEAGLIRSSDLGYLKKGTAVHRATELWDKGTLDESTVHPDIIGYLESWKCFRKDQNYTPLYIEKSLFDSIYLYAGTVDRLPLLDLKSGSKEAFHKWQLAGYWNLCKINGFEKLYQNPQNIYLDSDGGPPMVLNYTQAQMREALKEFFIILSFVRLKRSVGIK